MKQGADSEIAEWLGQVGVGARAPERGAATPADSDVGVVHRFDVTTESARFVI